MMFLRGRNASSTFQDELKMPRLLCHAEDQEGRVGGDHRRRGEDRVADFLAQADFDAEDCEKKAFVAGTRSGQLR